MRDNIGSNKPDRMLAASVGLAVQAEPVNAEATDAALSDKSLLEDLSSGWATRMI